MGEETEEMKNKIKLIDRVLRFIEIKKCITPKQLYEGFPKEKPESLRSAIFYLRKSGTIESIVEYRLK